MLTVVFHKHNSYFLNKTLSCLIPWGGRSCHFHLADMKLDMHTAKLPTPAQFILFVLSQGMAETCHPKCR